MPDRPDLLLQLYNNILGSNRIGQSQLGTYDIFRTNITDPTKAQYLYNDLTGKYKFSQAEIGDFDTFYKSVQSYIPTAALPTERKKPSERMREIAESGGIPGNIPFLGLSMLNKGVPTPQGIQYDFTNDNQLLDTMINDVTQKLNVVSQPPAPPLTGGYSAGKVSETNYDPELHNPDYDNLLREKQYLTDAKDWLKIAEKRTELNTPNVFQQFTKGLLSPLAKDFFTMGLTEMNRQFDVAGVAQKAGKGEQLNDKEQALLACYGIYQTILSQPGSLPYNIGQQITMQIPYMVQFAATNGAGTIAKEGMNSMLGIVGKNLGEIKQFMPKLAQVGREMPGLVAKGAVQTATMPMVYTNMGEKIAGQVDPEGNIISQSSLPVGMMKGLANSFPDILTESMGTHIIASIPRIGTLLGKKAAQGVSRWLTPVQKFKGAAMFGSFPEEFSEEMMSNVITPMIDPDTKASDVWTGQNILTTTITLAAVGGGFYASNVAYKSLDEQILRNKYLSDLPKETKSSVIDALKQDKPADVSSSLSDILHKSGVTDQQGLNIITYAWNNAMRRGMGESLLSTLAEQEKQKADEPLKPQAVENLKAQGVPEEKIAEVLNTPESILSPGQQKIKAQFDQELGRVRIDKDEQLAAADQVKAQYAPFTYKDNEHLVQIVDREGNHWWVKDGDVTINPEDGTWKLGKKPLIVVPDGGGEAMMIPFDDVVGVRATSLSELGGVSASNVAQRQQQNKIGEQILQKLDEVQNPPETTLRMGESITYNGRQADIIETGKDFVKAIYEDGTQVTIPESEFGSVEKTTPEQAGEVTAPNVPPVAQNAPENVQPTAQKTVLKANLNGKDVPVPFTALPDGSLQSNPSFAKESEANKVAKALGDKYSQSEFTPVNTADPSDALAENNFVIVSRPKPAEKPTGLPAKGAEFVINGDETNTTFRIDNKGKVQAFLDGAWSDSGASDMILATAKGSGFTLKSKQNEQVKEKASPEAGKESAATQEVQPQEGEVITKPQEEIQHDQENIEGLPGGEPQGEAVEQGRPELRGGTGQVTGSGDVQTHEEKVNEPPIAPDQAEVVPQAEVPETGIPASEQPPDLQPISETNPQPELQQESQHELQPWEMTREKFVGEGYTFDQTDRSLNMELNKWQKIKNEADKEKYNIPAFDKAIAGVNRKIELSKQHRESITQALSEGKPVPENVLADYPDLRVNPEKPTTNLKPQPEKPKGVESGVESKPYDRFAKDLGLTEPVDVIGGDAKTGKIGDATIVVAQHTPEAVTLESIKVPLKQRQKGQANAAMRDITDKADELGITLKLKAVPEVSSDMTAQQLRDWYRKYDFLFVGNTGERLPKEGGMSEKPTPVSVSPQKGGGIEIKQKPPDEFVGNALKPKSKPKEFVGEVLKPKPTTPEDRLTDLGSQISKVKQEIDYLKKQRKNKGIPTEREADLKKDLAKLRDQYRKLDFSIPIKENPDAPPMPTGENLNEWIGWVRLYSTNPQDIHIAWQQEREHNIPYDKLHDWQLATLETRTTIKSFTDHNDKNNITQGLIKRFTDKNGTPLDRIAAEKFEDGIDVTPGEVAQFMVDVVNNSDIIRKTTDDQLDLAYRFKKLTGYSINKYREWNEKNVGQINISDELGAEIANFTDISIIDNPDYLASFKDDAISEGWMTDQDYIDIQDYLNNKGYEETISYSRGTEETLEGVAEHPGEGKRVEGKPEATARQREIARIKADYTRQIKDLKETLVSDSQLRNRQNEAVRAANKKISLFGQAGSLGEKDMFVGEGAFGTNETTIRKNIADQVKAYNKQVNETIAQLEKDMRSEVALAEKQIEMPMDVQEKPPSEPNILQSTQSEDILPDQSVNVENPLFKKYDYIGDMYSELTTGSKEFETTVRQMASDISKETGVKVNIVKSKNNLDDRTRAAIEKAGNKTDGFYDLDSKEVTLILNNITSSDRAATVLLHEIVAHHGLRALFEHNVKGFNKLMDQVYDSMTEEEKRYMAKRYPRPKTGISYKQLLADEYVAQKAQGGVKPTWWGRFIAGLRNLLRQAFGKFVKWTDNDINDLLRRSRENLRETAPETEFVGDILGEKAALRRDGLLAEGEYLRMSAETAGATPENILMEQNEAERAYGSIQAKDEAIRKLVQEVNEQYADKSKTSGDKIKPRTVIDTFAEQGYVDFTGLKINNPQDVAELWSIHRSPYIEKAHVVFLKDGDIVGTAAYTLNKPGSTQFPESPEIRDLAIGFGANQFYLVHNHPSGNHNASAADIFVTGRIVQNLMNGETWGKEPVEMLGHVVIDHEKFTFISPERALDYYNQYKSNISFRGIANEQIDNYSQSNEYKNAKPRLFTEREALGSNNGRNAQTRMVEIGKALLTDKGYHAAIIYLSPNLNINAYDVPPENLDLQGVINYGMERVKDEKLGHNLIILHDGIFGEDMGESVTVPDYVLDIINTKTETSHALNQVKMGGNERQQLWEVQYPYDKPNILMSQETEPDMEGKPRKMKDIYSEVRDTWFGNRDVAKAKANVEAFNTQTEIQKIFTTEKPKWAKTWQDIDRAIQIHIDTQAHPEHIQQYWNDLTPRQQALVTASEELTPSMKAIADRIGAEYTKMGQLALDNMVIANVLENYVNRIWDISGQAGHDAWKKFSLTTRHSKKRVFGTIIEGMAKGYNLKVEGASNSLEILKNEIHNVIENRNLINSGKQVKDEDGNPLFATQQLPGYKMVEHPSFKIWGYDGKLKHKKEANSQYNDEVDYKFDESTGKFKDIEYHNRDIFITENGTVMRRKQVYAPAPVAKNLNDILSTSWFREQPAAKQLIFINALLKRNVLSWSFFHHLAFTRAYLLGSALHQFSDLNIRKSYKAGLDAYFHMTPDVESLIRAGMTIGRMQDWEEDLLRSKTLVDGWLDQLKVTKDVRDKIHKLHEAHTDFLFKRYGAGLKVKFALLELAKQRKLNPKLDDKVILGMIARIANDNFGGLHYERMGISKTWLDFNGLWLLARDWTLSNVRLMVKAIHSGSKAETRMYRRYWLRAISRVAFLSVGLNLMMAVFNDPDDQETYLETLTHQYKDAFDKPGQLNWLSMDVTPVNRLMGGEEVDQQGNEVRKYFNIAGHFKDPYKWTEQAVTGSWTTPIKNKGSIFARTVFDLMEGNNWQGKRYTTLAEVLGYDDKGVYMSTNEKLGYRVGEPKGGKLKGKLTKWPPPNETGGVNSDEMLSFILANGRDWLPIPLQNSVAFAMGETSAFDMVTHGVGFHVNTNRIKGYDIEAEYKKVYDAATLSQRMYHDAMNHNEFDKAEAISKTPEFEKSLMVIDFTHSAKKVPGDIVWDLQNKMKDALDMGDNKTYDELNTQRKAIMQMIVDDYNK
jgi:hypothetical protein